MDMIYSARQLIGKTMLLNKLIDIFKISDVNTFGDQAAPVGNFIKDDTFVVDSFLRQTSGYRSSYGITYAKRTYPFFTFFDLAGNYLGVKVIGDSRFSLKALKDQGALTVAEEIAAEKYENMTGLEKFFNNLFGGGTFKTVVIIAAVAIGGAYLISRRNKNN